MTETNIYQGGRMPILEYLYGTSGVTSLNDRISNGFTLLEALLETDDTERTSKVIEAINHNNKLAYGGI